MDQMNDVVSRFEIGPGVEGARGVNPPDTPALSVAMEQFLMGEDDGAGAGPMEAAMQHADMQFHVTQGTGLFRVEHFAEPGAFAFVIAVNVNVMIAGEDGQFLVTGDPVEFQRLGRRFLGPEVGRVAVVQCA